MTVTDEELRLLYASEAIQFVIHHTTHAAEATLRGDAHDYAEEGQIVGRYLRERTHADLVDMCAVMADLMVTKQHLLKPFRRDCPCPACAASREEAE